jgi:hypothetical protein
MARYGGVSVDRQIQAVAERYDQQMDASMTPLEYATVKKGRLMTSGACRGHR